MFSDKYPKWVWSPSDQIHVVIDYEPREAYVTIHTSYSNKAYVTIHASHPNVSPFPPLTVILARRGGKNSTCTSLYGWWKNRWHRQSHNSGSALNQPLMLLVNGVRAETCCPYSDPVIEMEMFFVTRINTGSSTLHWTYRSSWGQIQISTCTSATQWKVEQCWCQQ